MDTARPNKINYGVDLQTRESEKADADLRSLQSCAFRGVPPRSGADHERLARGAIRPQLCYAPEPGAIYLKAARRMSLLKPFTPYWMGVATLAPRSPNPWPQRRKIPEIKINLYIRRYRLENLLENFKSFVNWPAAQPPGASRSN
jgi:hypothetical protein